VQDTPSASSTPGLGQTGNVDVSYSASASPVTISLPGTTADSDHSLNILVGQHCTASITGLPDDSSWTTKTTYQWSVSGTTFQSWDWVDPPPPDFNGDEGHTNYVDGPGPLTNPTASWYWNDLMGSGASTSETVSCTATVTPPTGSPFTVTATKQVTVWRPIWSADGTGGEMQVSINPYGNGSDYWLWAAPLDISNTGGMIWRAKLSSPNSALFGDGSVQIVQLVIPGESYTYKDYFGFTRSYSSALNGQEGLDSSCPYGWVTVGPAPGSGIRYFAGDAPGLVLMGLESATLSHKFEDYIIYEPPGSAQYVPLAHFVWSINGSATLPASGNWMDAVGSAGTVTPTGSATPFPQSNSFPDWTRVIRGEDL